MIRSAALGIALALVTSAAQARPATCETTDDGTYPCDFQPTDRNGSFKVTARGKPTYTIEIDEPGSAFAFAEIGGRNVSLPGKYRFDRAGGCWVGDATGARICAR